MTKQTGKDHVVIVGAGVVGMSCALFLQREGFAVTVIDRLEPGMGCSYGNASGIATSEVIPISTPGLFFRVPKLLLDPEGPLSIRLTHLPRLAPWLWRFLRAGNMNKVRALTAAAIDLSAFSVEDHASLRKEAGAEHLLVGDCCAAVYDSEKDFERDRWQWALREELGFKHQKVSGHELHELEPAVSHDIGCAMLIEGWRQYSEPYEFVALLAQQFERNGGNIRRGDVTGFETNDNRVKAVCLSDGTLQAAGHVVIAAGAWSHRLSAQLGSKVPLEADRGYNTTIADAGVSVGRPILYQSGGFAITQLRHGLRIGGAVELADVDAAPNYARADAMVKRAKRILPGLANTKGTQWMGPRPALPDFVPVIGPSPHFSNVQYAFGHGHVGLTWGPTTGRLIAQNIAGKSANIDMTPFRVDRFQTLS